VQTEHSISNKTMYNSIPYEQYILITVRRVNHLLGTKPESSRTNTMSVTFIIQYN
jgi:hypothetical protein